MENIRSIDDVQGHGNPLSRHPWPVQQVSPVVSERYREMGTPRVEQPVRVIGEVGVHDGLSSDIEVDDVNSPLAVGADRSRTMELHGPVPPAADLPQESPLRIPDLDHAFLLLSDPVIAGIIQRRVDRPVDVPRTCRVAQSHDALYGYAVCAHPRTLEDVYGGGAVPQCGQVPGGFGGVTGGKPAGQGDGKRQKSNSEGRPSDSDRQWTNGEGQRCPGEPARHSTSFGEPPERAGSEPPSVPTLPRRSRASRPSSGGSRFRSPYSRWPAHRRQTPRTAHRDGG